MSKLDKHWRHLESSYRASHSLSYRHDDEVQPAPGVREVLLEAVRRLFDQHFNDEDHRERTINLLHHRLQRLPLLQILVFDSLCQQTG